MADPDVSPELPPDHLEATIRALADHRLELHGQGTPFRRAVDRMTGEFGRPRFIGVISVIVGGWIVGNLLAPACGLAAIDPPPFTWGVSAIALVSLYMVVLVLITQRGEDRLSQHRELLILELAILGERKITKVIALLEEARHDNPTMPDRPDPEAASMGRPADPKSALATIKQSHVSAPE